MAGLSSRQIGKFISKYGVYLFIAYGFQKCYSNYSNAEHTYKVQYSRFDHERKTTLEKLRNHIDAHSEPKH